MTSLDHPYLTDQLIPYIGNKRKLLALIHKAVLRTGVRTGTFFDAFAGSGVVSRLAKVAGFRVVANDWEPYSQTINAAYVGTNIPPPFLKLGGLENAISALNLLPGVRGYIAAHYCPSDDEQYDTDRERMFYTQQNGRRIDAIREQIKQWRDQEIIDDREETVLLAPLIYQASYCSNTSGVFKGFHRGWGGATKTAWYRIRSFLSLDVPLFHDNSAENLIFRADAAQVADEIECDIAYLDPPYNQHQYGSNYHLLNTVTLWDKPELSPIISGNGVRDKAAIRLDWRTERRSPYCYKSSALDAFSDLVSRLKAKYILLSYSTDGLVPIENMLQCLSERGDIDVVTSKYKRYRVSSQRPSPRPHTTEFVVIVDTTRPARQGSVSSTVEVIMSDEEKGESE